MQNQQKKQQTLQNTHKKHRHLSLGERKGKNLLMLEQYFQVREISLQCRKRILLAIENILEEKTNYTKGFLKDLVRYFEQFIQLYDVYFKGMNKISLDKKSKQSFIYQSAFAAVTELSEFTASELQQTKSLTSWVQKMLLPALKNIIVILSQLFKKQKKEYSNLSSEFTSLQNKQKSAYQKIESGKDLLEKQLLLIQKIAQTNESLKVWGQKINECCIKIFANEAQIRQSLKNNILEFGKKYLEVYKKTQSINSLLEFWKEMPQQPSFQKVMTSILSQTDLQYIKEKLQADTFQQYFTKFVNMQKQQDRARSPQQLLKYIVLKQFKTKILRNQKQWCRMTIFFSIDYHVIAYIEKQNKIYIKLKRDGFRIEQMYQNTVELNGLQEGIIFDSNKKLVAQFDDNQQMQAFIQFQKQSKI